jgi:hypothetical protein
MWNNTNLRNTIRCADLTIDECITCQTHQAQIWVSCSKLSPNDFGEPVNSGEPGNSGKPVLESKSPAFNQSHKRQWIRDGLKELDKCDLISSQTFWEQIKFLDSSLLLWRATIVLSERWCCVEQF